MAAMFFLASCAENEVGQKAGQEGDEAFAGITVSIPTATRAADTNASAAESKINSIGIYIVDQTTNLFHYDVIESADFTENTATATASATKAVKTTTGTKDIYVVVNPTAALKSAATTMKGAAFKNILALDETAYYKADFSEFVMTGCVKGHTLGVMSATDAVNPANLINIPVDRNVAKVVLRQSATLVVDGGGTVSNIQYAMVSKNKASYISAQTTTPYYAVPANAITDPIDPYYDNFSNFNPGTYKNIEAAATAKDAADGYYVLENKTDNKRLGNTTAVRIKLVFTPDTSKGAKIIKSWNSTDGAVLGANSDMPTGTTFYQYTGGDNSYWTAAAYTAATASAIPANHFSEAYTGGVAYFKVYVAATNDGEKCVLRNYYYDMTLAKIIGPGKSKIDEEDGTDDPKPVEEDAWASVILDVKAWNYKATEWIVQ